MVQSPALQVMNTRSLKIESVGDYFYGRVSPKIRLSGRWLERAGFRPGNRVEVEINQPGILVPRVLKLSGANGMQFPQGDTAKHP
jgi:hypothetical protein